MNAPARGTDLPTTEEWAPAISGVYVHVPFCASDCAYCAFAREVPATRAAVDAYLDALAIETRGWRERLGAPVQPETIYVGGGTPTFLTPGEWDRLESALAVLVDRDRVTEITVEANPESATTERLDRLRGFGMTRLSLGAQALSGEMLRFLDRTHEWHTVADALARARAHDGLLASIDLIYGIPGLDPGEWARTLDAALELPIEHLSAYCLSYEEGTSLARRRAAGVLEGQPDEVQRRAYEELTARAERRGLVRYEVSNFGTRRAQSRHNLIYWEGGAYLGLGPSAHSHVRGVRFRNHTRRVAWERSLGRGTGPVADFEVLGEHERRAELLMRLRVARGVPLHLLPASGGPFAVRVAQLEEEGLLRVPSPGVDGARLALTPPAFFLSDGIAADLLAAWEEESSIRPAATAERFDR